MPLQCIRISIGVTGIPLPPRLPSLPHANSFWASFCWWNSHRTYQSVSVFVPPAWVLTTSIPGSVTHSIKLRERCSQPLSFMSHLWLEQKAYVENIDNFMRKRPVLWCWINHSLRFLPFRQEILIQIFCLLVDEKIFYPGECCNMSQSWGFCTWYPPTGVPGVFRG